MSQVNNKNIDNASGQVVRTDIQNSLKAVASNNFGQRASGGTILPCEFLADDTTNKLLIRSTSGGDQADPTSSSAAAFFEVGDLDTANLGLLPKTGGTLTGDLLGHNDASSLTPAYSFNGDPDTGMFRSNTNVLGFAAGGVERAIISGSGITISDEKQLRFNEAISNGFNYVSLKAPSALANNVVLTLPSAYGSAGDVLTVDGSNNLYFAAPVDISVPTGAIFCMAVASVPSGYLECNGDATISRTTYAALFAVIGTTYGAGDGSTTFQLPDLRGEFIRGLDRGRNVDPNRAIAVHQGFQNASHMHSASSSSSVGDSGHHHFSFKNARVGPNRNSHSLTTSNFPAAENGPSSLNESYNIRHSDAAADVGKTSTSATGITVSTTTAIGSDGGTVAPDETRPRNMAMLYVIKF